MRSSNSIFENLDWATIFLYILLVLLGWANIYAAVYDEEVNSILDTSQQFGKQMLWILGAIALIVIILFIDGSLFETLSYLIYVLSIISLIAILLFGQKISGARSWFAFENFSIQFSEFAKFATALALAKYLSIRNISLKKRWTKLTAFFLIFLPSSIIILQPDFGSALVYTSLSLVLFREGLPGSYIFSGFGLVVLFILSLWVDKLDLIIILSSVAALIILLTYKIKKFYWNILGLLVAIIILIQSVDYTFYNVLEKHHRNRINILLGKEDDPKGIGYNINQSLIGIGSGGFMGKGYLSGTQTRFDFIPEQSTDFIFCTVAEEWGFVGSSVVIVLFTLLFFRLVQLAERQKSAFSRVYGYCVVSILFFHFAINIAMTIGLAPIIGIPLPFFSYGGSSLWGFTILLFIFIKLDSYRMQVL